MTNEQLIEISRELDNYMVSLMKQYDIGPLQISAVVLARTMVLSRETGCSEDFLKLITGILANPTITKPSELKIH